jgi:hypothetical protein
LLPNFICIGAQKAGTTSVSRLLASHPDVYMPAPPETRFFVDDALYEMGLPRYELGWFANWAGQTVVGEKTPEYLLFDDTPGRVADALGPDLRLIVCLRRPADRAHSHYRHNLMLGIETMPFLKALQSEPGRIAGSRARTAYFGYRYRGQYARRLEPWLAVFDRSRLLAIDFDDLIDAAKARQTSDHIFAFLGLLPPHVDAIPKEGRPSPATWIVRENEVARGQPGAMISAHSPSGALRAFAERAQSLDPGPLSRERLAEMQDAGWRDEIAHLEVLLGLNLQHWLS